MKGIRIVLLLMFVCCVCIVSACGDGDSKSGDDSPVKIRIAGHKGSIPEENFNRFFVEPVKKQYPHIELERIDTSQPGMSFGELVMTGEVIDIVYDYPYVLTDFERFGITFNIEPLIKKHKFDLNRIQPEFLESIKEVSNLDYLVGLPMYNNAFALFYNIDLFDRMGVDPPKDFMTWEEVRALAVKITRVEDQVQYYGLWPDSVFRGGYQAGLSFVDLDNHLPVFQSAGWKSVFELWYSLWNTGAEINTGVNYVNGFKEGQVAMLSGYTGNIFEMLKVEGLNWDVVTYPSIPGAPDIGQRVDSVILSIAEQSKNKDAAFQVLSVILSEGVQTEISKNAMMSVLKEQKVHDQFGKDTPELAGKNVIAFTKMKLAKLKSFGYVPTSVAAGIPIGTFTEILNGKDINTALREADEKMALEIKEARMKLE